MVVGLLDDQNAGTWAVDNVVDELGKVLRCQQRGGLGEPPCLGNAMFLEQSESLPTFIRHFSTLT